MPSPVPSSRFRATQELARLLAEVSDDGVQLQVVKALLPVVTSNSCEVHEEVHCGNSGAECCGHGWCTTPGVDNCRGATRVPANGYTESCKGTYSCCAG